MKRLPLYHGGREDPAPWESSTSADYDSDCAHCDLGRSTRGHPAANKCVPPEGFPGGVLVVGDYPSRDDDSANRPFYGQAGRYVREQVARHWQGPTAYDSAVKCRPETAEISDLAFRECGSYLKRTVEHTAPTRIIALGGTAIRMLVGRKMQVLTNRRGYGFTSAGVPVFMLPSPAAAMRNRFIRQWFEEDLEHALTVDAPTPPWRTELLLIEDEHDALLAEQEISASGTMVFDVETVGPMFDSVWFRIISLAACGIDNDDAWVWPGNALDNPALLAPLKRLLTSPKVGKIGSNVKYDVHACRSDARFNLVTGPLTGDTRVWRKMIFSDADGSLGVMTNLVGMAGSKLEAEHHLKQARLSLTKHRQKHGTGSLSLPGVLPDAMQAWLRLGGDQAKFIYGMLPEDVLYRYNARDTVATRRLAVLLRSQMDDLPHVSRVWDQVVRPAIPALEQVEAWGMAVSTDNLDTLGSWLRVKLDGSLRRIHAHKPGLDPGKDDDLRAWLYGPRPNGLALKPKKFTEKKKLPAVDAESLEFLKDKHPIIPDLLEWSKLDKLRGTYVDGMREHIAADGRIHPSLHPDGAVSGRLSCSDPNLQNIPRAKGLLEAKMVKDVFRAPPGRLLVQGDFSQLELRVAALLSGDQRMLEIFTSGEDYHLRCAKLISQTAWGVHPDNVLPGGEYRSKAKGFVFGLLYGMTDGGLARRMGCTKDEAARIRKAVLGQFPRLAQWIAECLHEARRTGWTYTWWNGQRARQRTLWQIAATGDADAGERITAENSSYNSPCQGTASDFCLASVAATVEWILEEQLPAKLVIPVHDSIMLECDDEYVPEMAYGLHRIMTSWNSGGVPLVVDLEVGRSWGSMVPYRYHATQSSPTFDKRFTELSMVDEGVEAVHVRAAKTDAPVLHRYEFNPVVVAERDAVEWLRARGCADTIVKPWEEAA